MPDIKSTSELITKRKSRKPKFIRQDTNKLKRLRTHWRKPKGIHSKLRNHFKGHRSNVSVGWKSSCDSRGLINGLQCTVVFTLNQIVGINPSTQGISIGSSVGYRKRLTLINKAKELGINIINIKDVDKYISDMNAKREEKKKLKKKETPKEIIQAKEKPVEKVVPKEETKSHTAEAEKVYPIEEKKEPSDKEEMDKLLTKRN